MREMERWWKTACGGGVSPQRARSRGKMFGTQGGKEAVFSRGLSAPAYLRLLGPKLV